MCAKKTHEEFLREFYEIFGNDYEVLSSYKNARTEVEVLHKPCNKSRMITPNVLLSQKRICPYCSTAIKGDARFKEKITTIFGNDMLVLGEYVHSRTPILMYHAVCCNEFESTPDNIINKMGKSFKCPKCPKTEVHPLTKTTEEFKQEVRELTNSTYEVLGEYIECSKPIKMKHLICGHVYNITPTSFLNGHRCRKCANKINAEKRSKTHVQFIEEVFNLVGREYEVLSFYTRSKDKVNFKHALCGRNFSMIPNAFLRGQRCPYCYGTKPYTTAEFKNLVYSIVGDEYEVLSEYITAKSKIKFRHNECKNVFYMSSNKFLRGCRCSICNSSKGERRILEFLKKNNINFKRQYVFEDCRNIYPLPFDFGILDENDGLLFLIEYHGKQHYEPIEWFGGEKGFEYRERLDLIKYNYCITNNIKLLVISHKEYEHIDSILKTKI